MKNKTRIKRISDELASVIDKLSNGGNIKISGIEASRIIARDFKLKKPKFELEF